MSDFLKIESESSAMLFCGFYAEDRLFLLVLGDRRASKKTKILVMIGKVKGKKTTMYVTEIFLDKLKELWFPSKQFLQLA